MLTSNVVADVEPSGLDLEDAAPTNSTLFHQVCLNKNHEMTRCQWVKNYLKFIWNRTNNLFVLHSHQKGTNNEERSQQLSHQQHWNCLGEGVSAI